jgi:hypothetical protein
LTSRSDSRVTREISRKLAWSITEPIKRNIGRGYRTWYERELKRFETKTGSEVLDPQQIQAAFPQFNELQEDLQRLNESLMRYRTKMRQLVMKD